jgi:hypothetical protein
MYTIPFTSIIPADETWIYRLDVNLNLGHNGGNTRPEAYIDTVINIFKEYSYGNGMVSVVGTIITITNMVTTAGISPGQKINSTAGTGSLVNCVVATVPSLTSITVTTIPVSGTIPAGTATNGTITNIILLKPTRKSYTLSYIGPYGGFSIVNISTSLTAADNPIKSIVFKSLNDVNDNVGAQGGYRGGFVSSNGIITVTKLKTSRITDI